MEKKIANGYEVRPPLKWAYTITMDDRDWLEFFETAMHPSVVGYLSRPVKMRLALRALGYLFAFMLLYTFILPVVWVSRLRRSPVDKTKPSEELAHSAPPGSASSNPQD